MQIAHIFLNIFLLMTSLSILVLAIETFSAAFIKAKSSPEIVKRPKISIVIPAYNEELAIASCISSIRPQLTPLDNIIVVADNCDDSTVDIANQMGAIVMERKDDRNIGKSYALDYGVYMLKSDPPDVVIIIDADVTAKEGAIEQIASLAFHSRRPVQASYLLNPPKHAGKTSLISAFAFCFKNHIRPLGMSHLGFPCLLAGSGMAIPWSIISSISFKSGSIVEDMQLAVDLTIAGHGPLFCPDAQVVGSLPQSFETARQQRTRWEHGHLMAILKQAPTLLYQAVIQLRLDLFALGIDLMIPPLSFLLFFWAITAFMLITFFLFGAVAWGLIGVVAGSGLLLGLSIFSGWFFFARSILPFRVLLVAPFYAMTKIPIYVQFFIRPEKKWIRTQRESHSDSRHLKDDAK